MEREDLKNHIHVKGLVCLCFRCKKRVFGGEEKRSDARAWHPICYTCGNQNCRTRIDSTLLTTHKNRVYCKYCHPLLFGPNGYGFGIPATLITERDWHRSSTMAEKQTPGIAKAFIAPLKAPPEPFSVPRIILSDEDIGDSPSVKLPLYQEEICNRCKDKIIPTERIFSANVFWHKNCFTCNTCQTSLHSDTVYERNGEVFCGKCGKNEAVKPNFTDQSEQEIQSSKEINERETYSTKNDTYRPSRKSFNERYENYSSGRQSYYEEREDSDAVSHIMENRRQSVKTSSRNFRPESMKADSKNFRPESETDNANEENNKQEEKSYIMESNSFRSERELPFQ